jgi:DMSO/TMAO reductase YedYZ molybdopterin-dependent catalytic subunit
MDRIAPKPLLLDDRKRVALIPTTRLTERLTSSDDLLETSALGVPTVSADNWRLEICGLVDRPLNTSYADLINLPKRTMESVFVCSGNPARPTVPQRRVANLQWAGVDLADLLERAGVRPEATHMWSYGLDYGEFYGARQEHYVKDMPIARLSEGNVLIAYELNGAPLRPKNGFPARLVIPGFYGTNSVKWLCRLELRNRRASEFMTTRLYNDPDFEADPTGEKTKPVWMVAPESVIIAPAPESTLRRQKLEIWGWSWSACPVVCVEVSVDAGETWASALLEKAAGLSWQRFSYPWLPSRSGRFDLRCRAIDKNGRTQPKCEARNSVQSIAVTITG